MTSMQVPAAITYHKPGTRPPLYVAGTFSNPPWQPCEMDHTIRDDGEYDFKKQVYGEPGSKIQYKFRIGDGDWWVLKDDGPTTTDSSGNTNHVLEIKPQEEQNRPDTKAENTPWYAKAATKHLQPSTEPAAPDRSGTGTPIFARVAAEVADSAALLHEEVPEREKPDVAAAETTPIPAPEPEPQKTAVEDGGTGGRPETRQSTILILEPPPSEGRPFQVGPGGEEFPDHQEEYIADKSPLFAHECVGLYESDEEIGQLEADDDVDIALDAAPVRDVDVDKVDLDDPTLERFPSNREEIMDAVRKLETGLQEDEAFFEGNIRASVVSPSRRGTEDITGELLLSAPHGPPTQRDPKWSSQGSVSSIPTTSSLHSISEAEEPPAEEEASFRPAVVFSNPLKPRPKYLKVPTSDEDEGVALPDGVSPKTVKPPHRPLSTPPAASPPPSPNSQQEGADLSDISNQFAPAEVEHNKDKKRSMQEVRLHQAPMVDSPDRGKAGPPERAEGAGDSGAGGHARRRSDAQVAASMPSSDEGPGQPKPAAAQSQSAGHYRGGKPTAPEPLSAEGPGETTTAAPEPPSVGEASESKATAPHSPVVAGDGETKDASQPMTRRLSYAQAAALKPSVSEGPSDSKEEAEASQPPARGGPEAAGPSPASATAVDSDTNKPAQLTRRAKGTRQEVARTPESPANVPSVQPKLGGGWIRAIFRLIFVDLFGGIFKRLVNLVARRKT